jgi:hypothetical protein
MCVKIIQIVFMKYCPVPILFHLGYCASIMKAEGPAHYLAVKVLEVCDLLEKVLPTNSRHLKYILYR